MNSKIKHTPWVWAALAVFVVSLLFVLKNINIPAYGGDELWYATPLLTTGISDLKIFQFVYAGPLKTILAAPVFSTFGFNVYVVRLFSLSFFVLGIIIWGLYLRNKKYWWALCATLVAAALHFDLLFFAKVDINQPTFHNTFTICYFIVFIQIIESGTNWWRTVLFLVLSFVAVNNHIRNIWISNAFLVAMFAEMYISSGKFTQFISNFKPMLLKYWPVIAGWMITVAYFIFTLIHFDGTPLLEGAKALGGKTSWPERLVLSFTNFPGYVAGGMVFSRAYAPGYWPAIVLISGSIILLTSIFAVRTVLKLKSHTNGLPGLLRISMMVLLLIFIQYVLTKSAKHPWHGNSLILFSLITFGLIVQALFENQKFKVLIFYLALSFSLMTIINIRAYIQLPYHPQESTSYKLAVWDLQALDSIRHYIASHPGNYHIADWGVGRPLALESKYNHAKRSVVTLVERSISDVVLSSCKGDFFIRATPIGLTSPDYTDKAISAFDAGVKFITVKSFFDKYGREIYQAGYFTNENNPLPLPAQLKPHITE